jgi:ethanolamine permease
MYQLTQLVPQPTVQHDPENFQGTVTEVQLNESKDQYEVGGHEDDELDLSNHSENGDEPKSKKKKYADNSRLLQIANYWDVLAIGICLGSANLTYGVWRAGLTLGFWSFIFAVVMIASVFFSLHLCIAEMISILPFSGGMYGFARVTLGPYLGFMVGCYESVGNIIYAMYGMLLLSAYLSYITDIERKYQPIMWLGFYLLIMLNEFLGRKYYFILMRTVAILLALMFLFYVAISIPKTHPKKYLQHKAFEQTFDYGAELTIVSLQYAAFIYFGIEIIPLVSDEVKDARKDTPRALMTTVTLVTIFAFLIMVLSYFQFPGYPYVLIFTVAPLNSAFENTFDVTDKMITVLAFFSYLAAVSIYVYGFAKQMRALGSSKLLPAPFAWTIEGTKIPYMSLIIGCSIGYALLLLSYFRGQIYSGADSIPSGLYLGGYLFTYFSFILILISFIVFRVKYYNLKREFTSPLGIMGAVYAIGGFLMLLYILTRYTSKVYTYVIIFCCFSAIMSLYYYFFARHRQTFSEEEQRIMFVVYLMKCKIETFLFLSFPHNFLYILANEKKRQALNRIHRSNSMTHNTSLANNTSVARTTNKDGFMIRSSVGSPKIIPEVMSTAVDPPLSRNCEEIPRTESETVGLDHAQRLNQME